MNKPIKNRNLPLLLSQARESVISHFRPLLNHFGLTEQQWRVLRVLCEQTSAEPRELCEICQILSPSMAGILKRLEEMGLVRKEPVQGDKRRVKISLSPQSKSLIDEIIPLIRKQYQLLEETWGEELVNQLYDTLDACLAVKDKPVPHVELPERNA